MKSLSKNIFIGLTIAMLVLPLAFAALTPVAYGQSNVQTPEEAGAPSAGGLQKVMENIITGMIGAVRSLLGYMLDGAVFATRWMLDYGTTVMDFPVVKSGFEVTLSFVNLLFVMALIVLAFEIILDYHAGEAKKTLGKLILAALLINFSLLIAGFLLDISNIFTNYFLKDISAVELGKVFEPQRFLAAMPGFGDGFWGTVIQALFSLVMTAMLLITMVAVLVMTTVRNVAVAGLLLVMPLIWGLWVFPNLKDNFGKWWKSFMKYGVTYLPAVTFFLWLAIATAGNLEFMKQTSTANVGVGSSVLGGMLSTIIQMVLLIGIIVFGLKAAEEAGDGAHAIATGIAKRTGRIIGGGAKGLAKMGWEADIRGHGPEAYARGAAGAGARATQWLRNIPYVGAALPLAGVSNRLASLSHRDHDVEDTQKNKMSQLSNEQLFKFQAYTNLDKAAKLAEISKRGKVIDFLESRNLDTDTDAQKAAKVRTMKGELESMARASADTYHKHGSELTDVKEIKDALDAVPALAGRLGVRSIPDQMKRLSAGQAAELHPTNFDDTREGNAALAALGNNAAAVRAIFTNGSERLQKQVREGFARLQTDPVNGLPAPIQRFSNALRTADETVKLRRDLGFKPENDVTLRNALAAREAAINNINGHIRGMANGTDEEKAERARVTGLFNGEAVRRQVVARDSGNVINP